MLNKRRKEGFSIKKCGRHFVRREIDNIYFLFRVGPLSAFEIKIYKHRRKKIGIGVEGAKIS